MLFGDADAPLLRAWIIQRLANISDADADVLADYVLALLRHDGDVATIRQLFEDEMKDFLGDDASAFIDDVFQAVKYRSYLPGAPPPPAIHPDPVPQIPQIPQGPASQQQQLPPRPLNPELSHVPYADPPSAFSTPTFRNGSRKRSYRDLDAPDPQPGNWNAYASSSYQHGGQPPYKSQRRGGGAGGFSRASGFADSYGMRGRGGPSDYPATGSNAGYGRGFGTGPPGCSPLEPSQAASAPPIDANTILENIRYLQELGAQMGVTLPQTDQLPKPVYSGPQMAPRSQRRRQPCKDYETKGFCSRGNRCMFEHGSGSVYVPSFAPPVEEYDPNNATMSMPTAPPGPPLQPLDMATLQMPPTNRRELKKPRRKGGRAPFSSEGPTGDRTNTKIVVENIPEEHFSEDEIRSFFIQFGTIEEILLRRSHKCIAIVKFDNWAAANAAWKSPKVVFDNRFVKIYWYKDEEQAGASSGTQSGSNNKWNGENASVAEPEFDMEEFKLKQEAAQKAHEEKLAKRAEVERKKIEIEEKQRELFARKKEEERKLQAKLAENGIKEDSLSPILSRPKLDGAKPSQAEALRAQLAKLEEEANSLGIDPDATQDETSSWMSRGFSRGRRPYRGRGSFPPRSYRGGATHDRHAAYAAYSLDNRPKIVAITGIDFTDSSKDEALRQYLFGIGEFTAIHSDPSTTHITFKDRKTAEQFMFGVSASKSIPDVDGQVELSWATSAPKAVGADNDHLMASGLEEEHAAKVAEADESNTFGGGDDARDQGDMDYEAGEGDIW